MKIVMNGDAGIIHAYCIHIVSSYISNVYDIYVHYSIHLHFDPLTLNRELFF